MSATLGEFEQLILLGLMRLGPDAHGASVRREIEEHRTRGVVAGLGCCGARARYS